MFFLLFSSTVARSINLSTTQLTHSRPLRLFATVIVVQRRDDYRPLGHYDDDDDDDDDD